MPTYVYSCADCEHRFEIYQSFSDDSLTQCPECEGRLRKVFDSIGVVFKGSGFYQTDSRAESEKASKSAKTEASSSDSAKSSDSSGSPASSTSSSSSATTSSTTGSSDSKAAS